MKRTISTRLFNSSLYLDVSNELKLTIGGDGLHKSIL